MILKILWFWIQRLAGILVLAGLFYLALFLLSQVDKLNITGSPRNIFEKVLSERDALRQWARRSALDYDAPSFKPYASRLKTAQFSAVDLEQFCGYYQHVLDVYPDNWGANFLLGVCRAHKGQRAEAQVLFSRASQVNPFYLWIYFDHGVMAFEDKDFALAASMFQRASNISFEDFVSNMIREKIFFDIIQEISVEKEDLVARYFDGIGKASLLKKLAEQCAAESGSGRQPEACSALKIPLQIM